jgi:hypothetical protein
MPLDFKFLGNCHNVAIALHKLTNSPLCVLFGEREVHNHEKEFVLIHVGILYQGFFVDELGIQGEPENLLQKFKNINEPYSKTQIYQFESYEDPLFLETLRQTGARIIPEKIAFFMEWAKDQKQLDFIIKK